MPSLDTDSGAQTDASAATPGRRRRGGRLRPRFGVPRGRRAAVALLAAIGLAATPAISTAAYLEVPAPTGRHAVGRVVTTWIDGSRLELRTPDPVDGRAVGITAWYPTDAAGRPGPYIRDLASIADALVAGGGVTTVEAAGLPLVRGHAIDDVPISSARPGWPVLLLSPGNETNVAFYATLGEELASRGYVVVGIDHTYQVGAVNLGGGRVAGYEGDGGLPGEPLASIVPRRIAERVADVGFVLDRLAAGGLSTTLGSSLDLSRVGAIGHSNGGIAAAEACAADARIDACLNIDGQAAGGPFSSSFPPQAPTKPFLYLTKETEMHARLASLFEAAGADTYRVVVPAATHDAFTDGPRFVPRIVPLDGNADATLRVARGVAAAFFDHALGGAPAGVFASLDAPTDILVEVYPLIRAG